MQGIRRLIKPHLWIVLILSILSTFSSAQTVPVTVDFRGTADVSSIQRQIDELRSDIDNLQSAIDELRSPAPAPPPEVPPGPAQDPTPVPDPTPNPPSWGYGMNLEPVTSYTTAWPFQDIALLAKFRRNVGWVIYEKGHPPASGGGDYVASWTGPGTVAFLNGFITTNTQPGRVSVRVDPAAPILIYQTTGTVNDLHIVPAGWDGKAFNPLYVERLRPFKVIRFMDWQRTNNSASPNWADRVRAQDNQATSAGVSIEYMIDLCNELGADPWFCMPHLADDAYVTAFAKLVKARLHPDAVVYIEYSNECWNTQFAQTQWLKQQGGGLYTDGFFSRWATEARSDFDIWAAEFPPERLVRVLGTQLQSDGAWIAKKLTANMPAGSFDALSPSAYFGFTRTQTTSMPAGVTAIELAQMLADNIETLNAKWYTDHGALARDLHVRLIAYEGGTHAMPVGVALPYNQALRDLTNGPNMIGLYDLNRQRFLAAGGDLLVAYNYVGAWSDTYGQFGHLAYQDQPITDAPRYQAVSR